MMVTPTEELTEFWRWMANGSVAISLYFIVQVFKIQRSHGRRLNNHAQRLAKLDDDVEPSAGD